MSFAISADEQASAEADMAAAFCDRSGTLYRVSGVPDGMGGESEQTDSTQSFAFGVVKRDPATIPDGERTRTVINATLKAAMSADVRELDEILDSESGERWQVQGIVATQFLLNLSCLLMREA